MERYSIKLGGRELLFYYICGMHDENSWKKPISFGYYKINFFVEVNARIVVDNVSFYPKKHDFIAYPRFSNHYGLLPCRQNVEYFEFLIPENFFEPLDEDGEMTKLLERVTSKKLFSLPSNHGRDFVEKIHYLREAFRKKDAKIHIVQRVLDILFDIESFCDNRKNIIAKPLSENLLRVITYMKQNFSTIDTVNDVAEKLHISRAYLTKLFREEIGYTPYNYLVDLKLEYSVALMREGKNVTQACFLSGFNSCGVYIEVFKKKFGTTPRKYLKKQL